MKKKVYCKECEYLGELVNFLVGNTYPFKVASNLITESARYCKNPIKRIGKTDTFYEHKEFVLVNFCHEMNAKNDCKYFKKKII